VYSSPTALIPPRRINVVSIGSSVSSLAMFDHDTSLGRLQRYNHLIPGEASVQLLNRFVVALFAIAHWLVHFAVNELVFILLILSYTVAFRLATLITCIGPSRTR